jgi:DNA (cytosine-5)-methyltransferase 1
VLAAKSSYPLTPIPTHSDQLNNGQYEIDKHCYVTSGEVLEDFSGEEFYEPEEVVAGKWEKELKEVPPGMNYKALSAWAGHPNPIFVAETRFWNFLLKLSPAKPSWTIAATPGPWTGPFHWSGRRLRTTEMAALQSFPKNYTFAGSRRERVRQIGNAAPPLLVKHMVKKVYEAI